MKAVKMKGKAIAHVNTPSLDVIHTRGQLTAKYTNNGVIGTIVDSLTCNQIMLPFGYVPTSNGEPTDNPHEIPGFVPVRMDTVNSLFYYYLNGDWHAVGGAGVSPTIDNAWVWPDGSFPIFADGSTIQLGG